MEIIRVLIIDDNIVDAKMVALYLQKSNSTTEQFTLEHRLTLKDGLHELATNKYDVLLLDLNLNDSAGLDTLELAKKATDITLVVLTGDEDERTGIRAIQQGAHDYLNKLKFDARILVRTLVYARERKNLIDQLQYQRNQFEDLVQFLPDALLLVDKDMKIILKNKAFTSMMALNDDEKNLNFFDFLYDKKYFNTVMKESVGDISFNNQEIDTIKRNGTILKCLLSCQNWGDRNLSDNKVAQKLITLKDITERKKLETMQKAKELAEQSVLMKQSFMASMSHEMRTPLNIIHGVNYLLNKTPLNELQRDYVKNQKFATENLLEIISNILDFSQIEAGKLESELEDFNLSHLMSKIISSFKPLAQEKNITLTLDYERSLLHVFYSDYFKIKQIVTNLVANAIKYTNKGTIVLKVYKHSENNGNSVIKFLVIDTGQGIPQEKFELIFDSFTQLPTENKKKHAGTGLGLTIVKELVNFMDGTISVSSQAGVGSTFEVMLRLKNSDKSKIALELEDMHSDASEACFKVLVAEDHKPNQLLIKTFLLNWFHGCSIDIADNGAEAIILLDKNEYDVVLMDLQMPEMDGFEATIAIRNSNKTYKNIPIIAVTAHALKHETDKCLECGMNDYITKPIDPEILKEKIEKALDLSESKTQAVKPLSDGVDLEKKQPKYQLLNLDYLYKLAMSNDQMMLGLLEQLAIDAPSEMQQLQQLTEQQLWKEIGTLAHKMKATASYLGMIFMVEHFNELITNGRTVSNTESIPNQVALVIQNFELCLQDLNKEISIVKNRLAN